VATNIRKGIVFDIKRYATDDGPGIRTTIFFKGCPLRCWWCHNPEGQVAKPELMYKNRRCINCGECAGSCPTKAINYTANKVHINRELCTLCGECAQNCPSEALTVTGKEISVKDLVKEVEKDALFYAESNGGITLSGGEPLLQIDFLVALLEECKERNIHTAVDTCGYAPHKAFDRISDRTDLFLYDIKTMNDKKHKKYTGVSNKLIHENLKRLAENERNIEVRFPIIPNINDDGDNIMRTAEFLLSCGVKQVSLLPYHRAGTEKYKSLNRAYKLKRIQSPSNEDLGMVKEKLETFGLKVKIGGG
jgi:pyruvate formate lyase activating enzyme